MDGKVKLLINTLGDNRVKMDVDLTEFLQSGLGGVVKALYIATTTRELVRAVGLCREVKINFLIIGCGSKMAVSVTGWDGLAIKNRSDNLKIFGIKGKVSRTGIGVEEAYLEADSGVSLTRLAEFATDQGLAGLEVLSSSPGSVGGSFCLNPVLQEKASQVKVLGGDNKVKTKIPNQVKRSDVILSVIFKLQAHHVNVN